jgi:diguanylate cyclase (GGDEF)-like protein
MPVDLPAARSAAPAVASRARLDGAVTDGDRMAALISEGLLDGGPDPRFDRFARLAARVAGVDRALVSVVSDDSQYFAGKCGVGPWTDARATPLSHSFCQHVVANAAPLVIEDARRDPVLRTNLAIRDLDVVAYAGFPIFNADGFVMGSLCAVDGAPHRWSDEQLESLSDISVLVGGELERRALVRRLTRDSRTDPLTGLANRRVWDEELPSALSRAQRLGHRVSVALLDIDHFKSFNDRHGHPAGDAALSEVARRWEEEIRDIDVLARIGGEEFGLLLPGCSAPAAVEIVERLRHVMPLALTASAGVVACAVPLSAEQLVAEADRALYRAKRAGRDRVCISAPVPVG